VLHRHLRPCPTSRGHMHSINNDKASCEALAGLDANRLSVAVVNNWCCLDAHYSVSLAIDIKQALVPLRHSW
jgi:hypothetical protein